MSALRSVRRWLPALMLLSAFSLSALTAQAQAGTFGELSRYTPSSAKPKLRETTNAFGVDPTDNSVYVGSEEGKERSNKFRLQKFKVLPGNKGELVASVSFQTPSEKEELLDENEVGIEGVAIDPEKHRLYVLARYERIVEPDNHGNYAASVVYAFSTEQSGTALVPAPGTTEGVLASYGTLKATSTEQTAQGAALIEPAGIAVDPSTHELMILGEVDEGVHERHVAIQRLTEKGAVGKRYVSSATVNEEGGGAIEGSASPVVAPNGTVYFQRPDELMEVSNLESSAPPTSAYMFTVFEEGTLFEKLVEFGTSDGFQDEGATLSLVSESAGQGIFYSAAEIYPYQIKEGRVAESAGGPYPGAFALNYSESGGSAALSDRGWTGGQPETEGHKTCAIGAFGETYSMIAGGKEGKLFVLDNPSGEEAEIVEFGPEGKGCPTALAAPARAEVNGKVVSSAAAGTPVKLVVESTANATSVEWSFGDGTTQTVSTGQYQTATVKHTFAKGGKYKVTAKVHTDDLTTEEVRGEVELAVTEAPKVTKQPTSKAVTEGENATFESEASGEPAPTVQWEVSTNGGSSWAAVGSGTSGGTTTKLTVTATTASENANEYRAKFTNSVTSATSSPATLTVEAKAGSGAPKMVKEPSAQTVEEGTSATFDAEASGSPTPTVQWEASTNGGSTWIAVGTGTSGGTTDVLSVSATSTSQSGTEYRAKFTNSHGNATSGTATLTVTAKHTEHKEEPKAEHKEEPKVEPPPPPTPGGGVLPTRTVAPSAALAGSSLKVSSAGAVTIKVSCPAGASVCIGTVTLRTLSAVSASAHLAKKAILTLATVSFSVAGGQTKTLTLHLSVKAKALLKHSHGKLRVRALVAAHDPAGEQHAGSSVVTITVAKSKH